MKCNICNVEQIKTIRLQTIFPYGTVCGDCIQIGVNMLAKHRGIENDS